MRKPREEGRSTRSSGSRTRVTVTNKKSAVPKAKAKAKVKPQPKKQSKDVERPVQVTVIRVRNPKTSKNILQGGISKQKNQQKKKTAAVVGALKEDLLKKLAEKVDDKLSGVVNTLLEVAVVSKKVIPRKKNKDEEAMQSSQEKPLKSDPSPVKQNVKSRKDSQADTKSDKLDKSDVTSLKEKEKKSSKDVEKKNASIEAKKHSVKDEKKPAVKEEKRNEKKVSTKPNDKKTVKKSEKKSTGKETAKQTVKEEPKEIKKVTRGAKTVHSESKKKGQVKPKIKEVEESWKVFKGEKALLSEGNKKDAENSKKDSDGSKKESDLNKKESDESKKANELIKKEANSKKEKDNEPQKKQIEKENTVKKELGEKKESELINKEDDSKKSKTTKDDDSKKQRNVKDEDSKKSKVVKDDESKKAKNVKDDENKKTKTVAKPEDLKPAPKKIAKKATVDSKKNVELKTNPKKVNEKEKSKNSPNKEPKKAASRPASKSREKIVKEEKKAPKKFVKRKPKIECELDGSAKISQILNTPKRHREASLNALAKVHCLYENESRGAFMDIIDKSERMFKEERKERATAKKGKPVAVVEKEKEVEEIPVRNLRTAPGLRSVGRHWEILNATSSSSEDSSDSASERKSVEEPPVSPPRVVEKKVKRRRKRSEVVMDLKDMVVKKRMASLNASAMMAATYSMDKRSNKSDDDSRRKDSDSRESSTTPEVVDVEETSDDEVILGGGRKKALVIVNQDTSDLTITGVYVNSTTRSTRHEGFCSISGMQYRISSTSHTQTETAVSTETTVIHTEHGESSRTAGSDGGSSCKTYTPLGALSSMQPPGSPRYPPSPSSSAFSAPPHHHPHHQDLHGYFQPAGPLISSSQLKAGPSQVEEMQGTSSQAVYTTYPPHPTGYLEPPGYPHAYAKYPAGYSPHRRYYPSIEPPYPPYPYPHYYHPYTPPPQPPPHYRHAPYMDTSFQPCPCPMPQTCPKNVHTGPLTGTSKGSESNNTVPPVGASRGPVQINPVALALLPEPNTAVNPPSPARGSAGLPPPASPALAQASWGTPPPPQSPGLLTAVEPQPKRKRRRTTSLSPPPPDHSEKLCEEPPDKLLRPIERIVHVSEKYERLQNPVDRFMPEKTLLSDRLQPPSETIIQSNIRTINPSETLIQIKPIHNTESLNQSNLFNDKINDRLAHPTEKVQLSNERTVKTDKTLTKCKTLQCEKVNDRSVHTSDKLTHPQTGRPPHPSDGISHSNDRSALIADKEMQSVNRPNHVSDKDQSANRLVVREKFVTAERLIQPSDRITQSDRPNQIVAHVNHGPEIPKHSERVLALSDRTLLERHPQPDRTKSVNKSIPQERVSRPTERLVPPISDLQNGHSPPEGDVPSKDKTEITADEPLRKRSLSRESATSTPKRRISVNKRTSRPKKLPSPAEADTPPRNSKSPENKDKKACVPLKNGRKKKDIPEIYIKEIVEAAQLRWSNGWSWRGEPFSASVYIRDDRIEVRKCYPAMEHIEGDIIHPRDCILLKSAGSRRNLPFVAKVAALWENPDDGEMMVSLLWYYRPEHTEQGRQPHQPPDEVFASRHKDCNSVACIEDKCYVLTFNEYCRYMKKCRQMDTHSQGWTPVPESETGYPRTTRMPPGRVSRDLVFFCRKVYDFRLNRILKNPC